MFWLRKYELHSCDENEKAICYSASPKMSRWLIFWGRKCIFSEADNVSFHSFDEIEKGHIH